MLFQDARTTLERVIHPLSLEQFLGDTLQQGCLQLADNARSNRNRLLGDDPEAALLQAYLQAPRLQFHATEPLGPPPKLEPVTGPEAFRAKIDAFHAAGYSVRIAEVRAISRQVDAIARALEFFLHKPVIANAFWSREGAQAPRITTNTTTSPVQLKGRKRWYISADPPELAVERKREGAPAMERYRTLEVREGDLLYLPRGTPHRVDALSDSIHISFCFVPLTVREAIIAALDFLSDRDRSLRETLGNKLAFSINSNDFSGMSPPIRAGVTRLLATCQSDSFIAQAMQRRSSNAIGQLNMLEVASSPGRIHAGSVLRHNPLAMSHCLIGSPTPDMIDLSYPGGHLLIHRGAEESVKFILATPNFRVSDIPGAVGDEIRIALAEKFLAHGILEIVSN